MRLTETFYIRFHRIAEKAEKVGRRKEADDMRSVVTHLQDISFRLGGPYYKIGTKFWDVARTVSSDFLLLLLD